MLFSTFALGIVLASLTQAAPTESVKPVGKAIVNNHCSFPVYLASVGSTAGHVRTISAGETFSEIYETFSTGGGVSIKVAASTSGLTSGPLSQFEYTLIPSSQLVYYDLSMVNGDAFAEYRNTIIPSVASCESVLCTAGEKPCTAAYIRPDTNQAVHACTSSAIITYHICAPS